MTKLEDLVVFQRALDLMVDVYLVTSSFPGPEQLGLTAELRASASAVVGRLSEGRGGLTRGDWLQVVTKARSALHVVDALVIVALELKLLDHPTATRLRERVVCVARPMATMLALLRKRLTSAAPAPTPSSP